MDTLLLKQGAESYGTTLDDAMLKERIDALAAQLGGEEALQAWMTAHGYDQEGFRTALRRQAAAAWMRDQVLASVPVAADQVHVQQILAFDFATAQRAYDLLETGWEFPDLAAQYDPLTRGNWAGFRVVTWRPCPSKRLPSAFSPGSTARSSRMIPATTSCTFLNGILPGSCPRMRC